jgi:hypothetical protein
MWFDAENKQLYWPIGKPSSNSSQISGVNTFKSHWIYKWLTRLQLSSTTECGLPNISCSIHIYIYIYNQFYWTCVCECLYPQNIRIHLVTHQVSYRPDSPHNHGGRAFYGDFTSKNVIIMEYINSFISLLQWAFILKRGTTKLAVFIGKMSLITDTQQNVSWL